MTTLPSTRHLRPSALVLDLLLGVVLAALVTGMAGWRLTASPPTWYDEGINLQAARNLARYGRYGLVYTADPPHLFDLQLTTGPTVVGPVSLVFDLFGVGLRQGRVVMLVYTLLAALGLYHLANTLYGPIVALLAVLLLCGAGEASPVVTRAVVGEIAAVAFLFWGIVILQRARSRGRLRDDVAAGALFGLAVLTKGQFGLLIPTLIGTWLFSRFRGNGWSGTRLILALTSLAVPIAAWQFIQLVALGVDGYAQHLSDQSRALSVSSSAPFLSETLTGATYLLSAPVAILGLLGLLYVMRTEVRHAGQVATLMLTVFGTLWLVWYLGFSIGYPRYTIPLVATCCLFAGRFIHDMVCGVRRPLRTPLVLLVGPLVAGALVSQLRVLVEQSDTSAQQMANVITEQVEPQATIESLEWELDVLADRPFHHPPPFVPAIPYAVPSTAAYLVDGPASKATELYIRELQQRTYEQIASAGPYDLYRRRVSP